MQWKFLKEMISCLHNIPVGDGRLHNLHINSDATTEGDALNAHVEF